MILFENIELCLKRENQLGSLFQTNIESTQGDGASALIFIEYLAKRQNIEIENTQCGRRTFSDKPQNRQGTAKNAR